MSQHDPEKTTKQPKPEKTESTSLERYDVSGKKIGRWTVHVRQLFLVKLTQVLSFGKRAADAKLPGSKDSSLKDAPAKAVDFVEARLEETSIQNQLNTALTESEHLNQELLRKEIKLREAETRSVQLDNLEKELRIRERIQELTAGRTDIHVIEEESGPAIIFGNLPNAKPHQLPTRTAEPGAIEEASDSEEDEE